MLSFADFKKSKDEKSIDSIFSNLEDDIAGIYIDPSRIGKITQLCAEWAESVMDYPHKKTLREHIIFRDLPATVKEASFDAATDARRVVKKYKCQFLEQYAIHPADNAEIYIDKILNNLKNDLITAFGVTPNPQSQPQQMAPPKKLNWWDRLKRWAKGVWYGPGDPKLRQFAQNQGFQGDDYYSQKESVDPDNLNVIFESVIKESVATLVQILNKYKQELMDVVRQALHYHDALKNHYGSYKSPQQPQSAAEEPKPEPEPPSSEPNEPKMVDDDDHDWEMQGDDRIPDIGDAKMTDFPVKDAVPPKQKAKEQMPEAPPASPEPEVAPTEPTPAEPTPAPSATAEEKPVDVPDVEVKPAPKRSKKGSDPTGSAGLKEKPAPKPKNPRAKGKAYLVQASEDGKLTFANRDGETTDVNYSDTEKNKKGIPISVDISGVPHTVIGTEFRKHGSHLLPVEAKPETSSKPEAPDAPEAPEAASTETEEDVHNRAMVAADNGETTLLDKSDVEKSFRMEAGKPYFIKGKKLVPIKNKVSHKNVFYVETGKGDNKWYIVSKADWSKLTGSKDKDPVADEEAPIEKDYSDLRADVDPDLIKSPVSHKAEAEPTSNTDSDEEKPWF